MSNASQYGSADDRDGRREHAKGAGPALPKDSLPKDSLPAAGHSAGPADGGGRGPETYCYSKEGAGGRLAGCIQNQLLWGLCPYDRGYIDRGVKAHPSFCVLRNTDMLAVLVEVGFIDSDDVGVLTLHGDESARALARGVTDYWQGSS